MYSRYKMLHSPSNFFFPSSSTNKSFSFDQVINPLEILEHTLNSHGTLSRNRIEQMNAVVYKYRSQYTQIIVHRAQVSD